MKTFRLIGMALLAVIGSVNFTACSSDDDEDNPIKNNDGIVTHQKKLMEIKETDEDGTNTITFLYDSKGRLISVAESNYDKHDNEIFNITWGNNSITTTNNGESTTHSLTEGLVRTSKNDYGTDTYAYNSSNQLIVIKETRDKAYDEGTSNYTWDNESLIKYTYNDGKDYEPNVYEYTYSGKTCKGWCPNIQDEAWDAIDNGLIFIAHPELVGMRTTQLPDQCYNKSISKNEYYNDTFKETYKYESISEATAIYTYKLNSDGYVESLTMVETDVETYNSSFEDKNGDGIISDDERNISNTYTETYKTVYTFKWE